MRDSFSDLNPEITVLMSCYNASRWLPEAIESVLAQTFKNFEFILVDDGSIDETWNIIQSYCDRDKRIVAITKKNTGLADSLNFGLTQARGIWIARLDADDLCEPTRLADQINFVRKHPAVVLLGTGFFEINEYGQTVKEHLYPSKHVKLVQHLVRMQRFFPHSSAFYRADLVREVNGYNQRIRRAEDCRLWLELSLRGEIACLSKPLVRIRKHSDQISHDGNGHRQLYDNIASVICHLLHKDGRKDPSVDTDPAKWIAFLEWVESRIEVADTLALRKTWIDARVAYYAPKNRLTGTLHFSRYLLESGNTSALMWEKFFGSSLPKHLSNEWIKRSCPAAYASPFKPQFPG